MSEAGYSPAEIPMNIVYIHRTKGKGVEGVHINEITRQLTATGHRVEMVSPIDRVEDDARDKVQGNGFSFSRNVPELLFEFLEIAYNWLGYRKLSRLSRRYAVDLIYERYAIFSVFGVFFARRRHVPIVVEANYTADLPLVRKRSALLMPLARRLDRYIFTGATRIVAVSSYVKNHLVSTHAIDENKILMLPNAADPEKFSLVGLDSENPIKTIGFVGGFYPWHGVPLLVRGFAELVPEFPDVRLCLVGDGPERTDIEQQVETLGITHLVDFTGQVAHENLAGQMAKFYIGVMPDSNVYGSPMKIFEYMSMGVPVVAPDYAPILDVVEDGQQGLVFRRQNLDELVNCLRRILASEKLRQKLSQQARTKIEVERNWKNNARLSIANLGL